MITGSIGKIGAEMSGDMMESAFSGQMDAEMPGSIVFSIQDQYDGPYEIVPKTEPQILSTREKTMMDDVTVREVPYFEVSNQFGGNTVYIAKELI